MTKFKFIQNLSIKNKIIAIILLVTYLSISLGFGIVAVWDINRLKSDIQSDLILYAKLIGDNCIAPLTFDDKQQATIALSRLRYFNYIETGFLYDKEGKLFAIYPDTIDKSAFLALNEQDNNIFKKSHLNVKVDVLFQEEMYGTVFLKANSQPIIDVKRTLLLTLSLIAFLLFIISSIIAGRMQRYISTPIIKLKKHVDLIAKNHDFSTNISKLNNDEIGSLYDGFNNLIKQIQTRSEERDTAEANYQHSQNKLDLALQGGEIGIWEWDLATGLTIWDPKMENMFGLKEGEFNQTYEAFKVCLHPDDISSIEKAIDDTIMGVAPYDIVYRVIWENKEVKFIRAKALVIRDKKENPISMIGICIDVSTIKKTEEELKKHRDELEELVNERTKELKLKYSELEKINKIFIDRELKMVELKKTIANLIEEVDLLKMNK